MSDILLQLTLFWFIAVLTPGPNMLFFTGVALSSPRRALLGAGLGIVTGTAFWGLSGLFGLLWFFEAFPFLGKFVRIAGGIYIAWIGFKILRNTLKPSLASTIQTPHEPLSIKRAYVLGLLTHLSNPKALVFVTSLFAATQLAKAPLWVGLTGVTIMVAMSGLYYVTYGTLMSLAPRLTRNASLKKVIGLTVGALMMAFGAKMGLGY